MNFFEPVKKLNNKYRDTFYGNDAHMYDDVGVNYQKDLFTPFESMNEVGMLLKALILKPALNVMLTPIFPFCSIMLISMSLLLGGPSDFSDAKYLLQESLFFLGGAVYFPVNAVFELIKTSLELITGALASIADACGFSEQDAEATAPSLG